MRRVTLAYLKLYNAKVVSLLELDGGGDSFGGWSSVSSFRTHIKANLHKNVQKWVKLQISLPYLLSSCICLCDNAANLSSATAARSTNCDMASTLVTKAEEEDDLQLDRFALSASTSSSSSSPPPITSVRDFITSATSSRFAEKDQFIEYG
jgi:hypothetical protein